MNEAWILTGGIWDVETPLGIFSSLEEAQEAANANEWAHQPKAHPPHDKWESQDNISPYGTETIYGPFKLNRVELETDIDPRHYGDPNFF